MVEYWDELDHPDRLAGPATTVCAPLLHGYLAGRREGQSRAEFSQPVGQQLPQGGLRAWASRRPLPRVMSARGARSWPERPVDNFYTDADVKAETGLVSHPAGRCRARVESPDSLMRLQPWR
jgi:hypothetical protein